MHPLLWVMMSASSTHLPFLASQMTNPSSSPAVKHFSPVSSKAILISCGERLDELDEEGDAAGGLSTASGNTLAGLIRPYGASVHIRTLEYSERAESSRGGL